MLKVSKNEYINEDKIESICAYRTKPLKRIAGKARQEGNIREIRGNKGGFKTFIIFYDDMKMITTYSPETYLKRLNKEKYLIADPKRAIFNKDMVREITLKPNAGQRREIREKREKDMFVSLTRGKKTRYYLFMESGRIYGVNLLKELGKEEI